MNKLHYCGYPGFLLLLTCGLFLSGCQHPPANNKAAPLSNHDQHQNVRARNHGRIEKVWVTAGPIVKSGDLIYQILTPVNPEMNGARALTLHPEATGRSCDSVQESNALRLLQYCFDGIAQNIANARTAGYKRQQIEFQEIAEQAMGKSESGLPSQLRITQGSQVISRKRVFNNGDLLMTGERLDVAIRGDGFFEVRLPDGTGAYTRNGSFKLSSDDGVVTSCGLPIQGGFQPVVPGTTSISIDGQGEVTYCSNGGTTTFRLQLCRFANPSDLETTDGKLFRETSSSGAPEIGNPGENGFGTLVQGFVESSNVNVNEELVELMRLITWTRPGSIVF